MCFDVRSHLDSYSILCTATTEMQEMWEPVLDDIFRNTGFWDDDIHIITSEEQMQSLCEQIYTRECAAWLPHLQSLGAQWIDIDELDFEQVNEHVR